MSNISANASYCNSIRIRISDLHTRAVLAPIPMANSHGPSRLARTYRLLPAQGCSGFIDLSHLNTAINVSSSKKRCTITMLFVLFCSMIGERQRVPASVNTLNASLWGAWWCRLHQPFPLTCSFFQPCFSSVISGFVPIGMVVN